MRTQMQRSTGATCRSTNTILIENPPILKQSRSNISMFTYNVCSEAESIEKTTNLEQSNSETNPFCAHERARSACRGSWKSRTRSHTRKVKRNTPKTASVQHASIVCREKMPARESSLACRSQNACVSPMHTHNKHTTATLPQNNSRLLRETSGWVLYIYITVFINCFHN